MRDSGGGQAHWVVHRAEARMGRRMVVYVDDGGSELGDGDFRHLWAAVILNPRTVLECDHRMESCAQELDEMIGRRDFHFRELMSPAKSGLDEITRLTWVRVLADLLGEFGAMVFISRFTQKGWPKVVEQQGWAGKQLPAGSPLEDAKAAGLFHLLSEVAVTVWGDMRLRRRVLGTPLMPLTVILDQGNGSRQAGAGIAWGDEHGPQFPWNCYDPPCELYAPRTHIPGLQLADLAAWSFNRLLKVAAAGTISRFDYRFLQTIEPMLGCFRNQPAEAIHREALALPRTDRPAT